MCSAVIFVMDALREQEQRKPEPIQLLYTVQSMIDVSVDRLQGLRTQCLTSAEITQQEIRTLEGKLVKYFTQQILLKASFDEETKRTVSDIPRLELWLRAVGLGHDSIEAICSRVSSLDSLRERSDHELRALIPNAREEETRRLCRAMSRLKAFIGIVGKNNGVFPDSVSKSCENADVMELCWDSWDRRAEPRRHRLSNSTTNTPTHDSNANRDGKSPYLELRKNSGHLPTPTNSLTKSRSHESQLSVKPDDLCENGQVSEGAGNSPRESDPPTPLRTNHYHQNNTMPQSSCPRSPRTPTTVGRSMAHDIAHRFTKTFNMIATCDYCEKQMLFGTGLKCKECKFKCHRDCESKVPPSCGLPPEFVVAFREKFHKDGGYVGSPLSSRGILSSLTHRPRRRPRLTAAGTPLPSGSSGGSVCGGNAESSSNTSSCNSSSPSSPALLTSHSAHQHKHLFNFPEVKPATSTSNHSPSAQQTSKTNHDIKEEVTASVKSESSRCVSLSGSGSTDSGGARQDSIDDQDKWPRQNSLSMKEWDIPYDELRLFEEIGTGRFGTVYRGSWHGAVAVKVLHVDHTAHNTVLDTFKHEVATFRKTRHENLVLFMGACMKPPQLAIVTSLCKGMTLYTHIHLRRDKFNANRSVLVAQQIAQGMGYLHARGIIHKDLKTKNIFLENGKVVITDFGLFSVTKLCFGNNARGDSLGIPAGWACYLAPELVRALTPHVSLHLPFSEFTDVYAFGTVWYELLCGEWPFKGQPAEAIIWQVGRGVKQTLANLHASRDIKDILMTCWSYSAKDRPNFGSLLSTLEKLPRKRLARSPSHPVHLSRSADSVL